MSEKAILVELFYAIFKQNKGLLLKRRLLP